jgi:DNA-binding PucR family transcriptional regulator
MTVTVRHSEEIVVAGPARGGLGLAALAAMQEALGARAAGMAVRLDGKDILLGTDADGVTLARAGAAALEEGAPAPGADAVAEILDADDLEIGHVFLAFGAVEPDPEHVHVLVRNLGVLLRKYHERDSVQASYDALLEIGMELQAQEPRLDAVFKLVVRRARTLLDADLAWLALLRDEQLELTVVDGDHDPDSVADGLATRLSVPLAFQEELLGVLYVGSRSPTEYSQSQASLLSALANQASLAIANAQLYASREERNRLLERTFEIHRELTEAGLAGVGLDGIGQAVAELLGTCLVLEQDVSGPLHRSWSPAGQAPCEDAPGLELTLLGGIDELGVLRLPRVDALDTTQRMALEQGGTVIALELAKLRMARDVEWRLRGEILEELLELSGAIPVRLGERAALLGVDLTAPWCVLVVERDGGIGPEHANLLTTVRGALAALDLSASLTVRRGAAVVVALEAERAAACSIPAAIIAAGRRAGAPCSVGISSPKSELALCYREARACLRLARAVGSGENELRFEQVGTLRFLLDAPDPQHAVALVAEELGALMRHDASSRTPLLATVRAYVEQDGHQPSVAARCFIHVSTLKYRIGRINDLLEEPLSSPETRFRLRLAFRVFDLLQALGVQVDAASSTPAGAHAGEDGGR